MQLHLWTQTKQQFAELIFVIMMQYIITLAYFILVGYGFMSNKHIKYVQRVFLFVTLLNETKQII